MNAVKGRTIAAAPMVDLGLKQLLIDSGIDLDLKGDFQAVALRLDRVQ